MDSAALSPAGRRNLAFFSAVGAYMLAALLVVTVLWTAPQTKAVGLIFELDGRGDKNCDKKGTLSIQSRLAILFTDPDTGQLRADIAQFTYPLLSAKGLHDGSVALRAHDASCFAIRLPTGSKPPEDTALLRAAARAFAEAPLTGKVTTELVYHLTPPTAEAPTRPSLCQVSADAVGHYYIHDIPPPVAPHVQLFRRPAAAGGDPIKVGNPEFSFKTKTWLTVSTQLSDEMVAGDVAIRAIDPTCFIVAHPEKRTPEELRAAAAALRGKVLPGTSSTLLYHFKTCTSSVGAAISHGAISVYKMIWRTGVKGHHCVPFSG